MANISIRVPDEIKKQASEVFSDLGLDMSTAINIFLRQSIKSNGLPFRPVNDPFTPTAISGLWKKAGGSWKKERLS